MKSRAEYINLNNNSESRWFYGESVVVDWVVWSFYDSFEAAYPFVGLHLMKNTQLFNSAASSSSNSTSRPQIRCKEP